MAQGQKLGKPCTDLYLHGVGRCKVDCQKSLCTGLALLFLLVTILLLILTSRSMINSSGTPHSECATQIKIRVQNWRKGGWGREKRKNRSPLC